MSNAASTAELRATLDTAAILTNRSPLSDPLASSFISGSSAPEPPNVTGTTLNRLFKLFGNPIGGVQAFLEANELLGHVLIADAVATDEVIDTDGLLSLREAVNIANTDGMMSTIVLEPGTYQLTLQGAGENDNATGDLDISDSLNLISAGGSTIDASNLGDRVFHNIWGALYLKNITVTGGTADYGGAIYNDDGFVNVTSSTFTNNSAGYGGAIYNSNYGTLNVTDSTFTNNSVNDSLAPSGYGGAIYNDDGFVNVTNSSLTSNSSLREGGAIYNSNYGTLNVTNSSLTYNSALYGGAILNAYGTLNVTSSALTYNSSIYTGSFSGHDGGGAIYNYHGTVTVTDSSLTYNSAVGIGGAILNVSGTLNVTDSTLTYNSASGGGAIYNYFGTFDQTGTNDIRNNTPNDIYPPLP